MVNIVKFEIKDVDFKDLLEKSSKEAEEILTDKDLTLLMTQAEGIDVFDAETNGKASDTLKPLKVKAKWLDERRKDFTRPWDDIKTAIKTQFDKRINLVDEVRKKLEKKMSTYEAEESARRRKEEEEKRAAEVKQLEENKKDQIEAAAESNNADLLDAAIETEEQIKVKQAEPVQVAKVKAYGEVTQTTWRNNWKYEVIDETLVPAELKSTDKKKVMDKIDSGTREIPGLRIYNEKIPVSR